MLLQSKTPENLCAQQSASKDTSFTATTTTSENSSLVGFQLSPEVIITETGRRIPKEEWELRMKLFEDEKKDLWGLLQASYASADSLILTISSAILGLSMTLTKDLKLQHGGAWHYALPISWLMFGLAILAVLLSCFAGRSAARRQLKLSEAYYMHFNDAARTLPNKWVLLTEISNSFSAAFFGIGVFCIIYFAYRCFLQMVL